MKTPQRFRIIRQLGEGGSGVVYEAFDQDRKTRVAIKQLDDMEPEALVRFKREFRALQDVHHPNLVTLGELISEGDTWFLTMDLVEGVDFLSYVRPSDTKPPPPSTPQPAPHDPVGELAPAPTARFKRSRLGPASDNPPRFGFDEVRLRSCLRQLALALAALHSAGLVHRDIKPNNVRVTHTGRLVLLDFGLVGDIAGGQHATTGAKVVGTPAYMAPEQAVSEPVGPAADLYSMGVVLYEALTGELPFNGTPVHILVQKQQREPAAPSSLVPDVPEDLDRLCTSLLRIDPARRPSTESVLRTLDVRFGSMAPVQRQREASGAAPFVGRASELAALRAAYRDSQQGVPVTVLVEGESGVGKSCLVKRFVEQLATEEPELVVLDGRCYERESVPYKAFDGVVDSLAHVLARMPKAEASLMLPVKASPLVQVFPVLRRVEAVARMPRQGQIALDPPEVRRRAFAGMRELLTRMSDHRPLVIVIEDMQWADADSKALLAEVLRPPEAPALLLVATLRTGVLALPSSPGGAPSSDPGMSVSSMRAVRERTPALPGARRLEIERLPSADARALAQALIARTNAPPRADPAVIAAEAEGHPLFIDALVRHSELADVGRGTLHLEDALWARVQRLDEPARAVMQLLAVAGAPIPQEVLATAADLDPATFAEHVARLRAEHLVVTTGLRGRDRIEPYHDRLRAVVRRRVPDTERTEHHRRIALAFETTGTQDAEMLALHWRQAGDGERALRYTVAAANDAAQALAFDRAAELYEQALALTSDGAAERRDLYKRRGEALANAGRGALAAKAFEAAADGAKAAESLELRRSAADQLFRSGHFDAGLAAIEAVLASVGMKLPSSPWTALVYFLFMRFLISLRGLGFVERDSSQIAPQDLTRVDVCWSVAFGLGLVEPVRAAAFQVRHLALALRCGEPYRVARALAIEVGYLGRGGGRTLAKTMRLRETALAHAERTKQPHALGLTLTMSGVSAYLAGQFRRGLEDCDRAERILRDECTGTAWEVDSARNFGLLSIVHLGDLRELRARQPLYVREALDRGDRFGAVVLRVGHPNILWLADDDPEGARAEVADAMSQWSKAGFHIEHYYELLAQTQADLYSGQGGRAYDRLVERWKSYRRSLLHTVQMLGCMSLQLRARSAVAAFEGGRRDRALLARARRDAASLAGIEMGWATPMADLLRAGIAHLGDGDGARAISLLRRALVGFEAVEMRLYAAATRRRLGGLVGGDEGAAMVRAADAWMTSQTVKDPARMTAMLAPGLSPRSGETRAPAAASD